jgi:hypothetical protein
VGEIMQYRSSCVIRLDMLLNFFALNNDF